MNRTCKRILLSILSLAVIAILFLENQEVSAIDLPNDQKVIDTYQYTTNSETREWKSRTIQQNREALRIPDDVLSRLSNKALYEAFITYPFLGDVYAYAQSPDDSDKALLRMKSYFSAYQEVLRRDLTLTELATEYALAQLKDDNQKVDTLKGLSLTTAQTFIESSYRPELFDDEGGYIAAKWIMADLVKKELEQDASLLNKVKADLSPDSAMTARSVILRTPRGSAVEGLIRSETRSLEDRAEIGRYYAKKYNVIYRGPADLRYNCHSYAWYKASTSNPYWINDPSPYMRDGSYSKQSLTNINQYVYDSRLGVGQKIFYNSGNHSAIVSRITSQTAQVRSQYAKSKFGSLGLYEHTISNVPYSTVTVTNWG